jgi:hypothetical protein
MSWAQIPGWSSDIEPWYQQLAHELPNGATFVEVGTLLGRSVACLGTLRPDLDLWAIDSWGDECARGEHIDPVVAAHGGLWPAFLACMHLHAPDVLGRLHVVRARSTSVRLTQPADVVFIDAAHDYDNVRADIVHWSPQVKIGGMLCGHDYEPNHTDVVRAVDECVGKPGKGPGGWSSVWWVKR